MTGLRWGRLFLAAFVPLLTGARGNACSAPPEAPTPDDDVSPGVEVVGFADTYLGNSWDDASCDTTYGMVGFEPASGAGYPLFVFTHGTFGNYQDLYTDAHIEAMAKKGFVAISIAYDNDVLGLGCAQLDKKGHCAYSGDEPSSAVRVACGRAKADCSKGIVVAGLSQGAQMATRAKNHNAGVRAAYVMGLNEHNGDIEGNSACLDDGHRALPANRLRAIHGESDGFATLEQVQAITGVSCPADQQDCLQPDGSGYYLVLDAQAEDGDAGHCLSQYAPDADCAGTTFDSGWAAPASEPWSLLPNLEWLAAFADPR